MESPSGSNPVGLPAWVRPTRWKVPWSTMNGMIPSNRVGVSTLPQHGRQQEPPRPPRVAAAMRGPTPPSARRPTPRLRPRPRDGPGCGSVLACRGRAPDAGGRRAAPRLVATGCRGPPRATVRAARGGRSAIGSVGGLPPAAEVLGVLVDGVPVGALGPGGLGDRLPPAGVAGEHSQPLGFQHVGVVDEGVAGGVVGQRRPRWLLAVAVAVALVAQILRVVAGPEAGRDGEVAVQHRPAGGVLVDQVAAGGVGVAVEVAGDGVEQDAALVGGVAVVVAVGAVEAALGGRAGDDRTGTHRVPPPGVAWRSAARDGVATRACGGCRVPLGTAWGVGGRPGWRLFPVDPGHGGLQQVVVVAAGGLGVELVDLFLGYPGVAERCSGAAQDREGVAVLPRQLHLDLGVAGLGGVLRRGWGAGRRAG